VNGWGYFNPAVREALAATLSLRPQGEEKAPGLIRATLAEREHAQAREYLDSFPAVCRPPSRRKSGR